MSLMMQDTRGRILFLLKKRRELTVAELARELSISPMGVRQHLAVLERDGLVTYTREKSHRGRPAHRYKLTPEAEQLFPSSYENFALSILRAISRVDGEDHVQEIFEMRLQMQKENYQTRLDGKDLKERVRTLAAIRDEEGYMAELEDRGSELILYEYNCPIYGVASEYRQACETELRLFRELLETQVTRKCHIRQGDHVCSYSIKVEE